MATPTDVSRGDAGSAATARPDARGGTMLPGHLLRRPAAVVALVVLVVNDQVLKRVVPGAVTGKLSDVAGVYLLPLALVSLLEAVRSARRHRPWRAKRAELLAAVAVSAIGFVAVKTCAPVAAAYGDAVGGLRWVPAALWAVVTGGNAPQVGRVGITLDATDLLVLPVLVVVAAQDRKLRAAGLRQLDRRRTLREQVALEHE